MAAPAATPEATPTRMLCFTMPGTTPTRAPPTPGLMASSFWRTDADRYSPVEKMQPTAANTSCSTLIPFEKYPHIASVNNSSLLLLTVERHPPSACRGASAGSRAWAAWHLRPLDTKPIVSPLQLNRKRTLEGEHTTHRAWGWTTPTRPSRRRRRRRRRRPAGPSNIHIELDAAVYTH